MWCHTSDGRFAPHVRYAPPYPTIYSTRHMASICTSWWAMNEQAPWPVVFISCTLCQQICRWYSRQQKFSLKEENRPQDVTFLPLHLSPSGIVIPSVTNSEMDIVLVLWVCVCGEGGLRVRACVLCACICVPNDIILYPINTTFLILPRVIKWFNFDTYTWKSDGN